MKKQCQNIIVRAALCVAALLLPAVAQAQQGSRTGFDVLSPTRVGLNEQFRIEFVAVSTGGGDITEFAGPAFPAGLNAIAGPAVSFGHFSASDGRTTTTVTKNTFGYFVQATALGKHTLPPASVVIDGKRYSTRALTIEVVADNGGGAASQGQPGQHGQTQQRTQPQAVNVAPPTRVESGDVLLRMDVNRTDVYKGEPIVATLRIYTRVGIAGLENPKYAAFNGFWAQELQVNDDGSQTTLNGQLYYSKAIRQWLLYPQRTGQLEIEQNEFTAVAQLISQDDIADLQDLIFGPSQQVRNVPVKIASPSVRIHVKELPQPMPETFDGAVGNFDMQASVSANKLTANSAGSITLTLTGSGSFSMISAPELRLPAAFEQYDTKSTEQISNTSRGSSGSRTYEYPFIARAEGRYTLPPLEFTYFDPTTGRYKTFTSESFQVEVTRDPNGGAGPIVSGVTKEDLQMLGEDIRFIRTGPPRLGAVDSVWVWSWSFCLLLLLILLLFAATLHLLKKQIAARQDIKRVRTKKASKTALRRLRRAREMIGSGNQPAFFEELLRALWGYLGDKLSIDVASLTKERVRAELLERDLEPEACDDLLDLIAECEFAQYSPSAGIPMQNAYEAALEAIEKSQKIFPNAV